MRHRSFREIDAELRRRIEQFIERAVAERDPSLPTVLALHATIDGATVGAERSITLGQDLVLPRSVVAHAGVDYVALGHIHRHQALGEHPPIVYAGSIERIDFGERNEDKGCVLVELAQGATRWRFHKLAARPFIRIEVDVRKSSDPAGRITAAIERHLLHEAVVRLDVRATREQTATLRTDELRQQLEQAQTYHIAAVSIEAERDTRGRLLPDQEGEDVLRGLTPRRALELYLQTRDTDPQRAAALLAAADELFAEE